MPGPRTKTATVNQVRSPAVPKAGWVKIYDRDGNLIGYEKPIRSGRLPKKLR